MYLMVFYGIPQEGVISERFPLVLVYTLILVHSSPFIFPLSLSLRYFNIVFSYYIVDYLLLTTPIIFIIST